MPPSNIARILNNGSNLRILEKLKARPYYPRELAADMGLSESFVVRRLKAMEEHDIVEGKWENEGSRKVKRYYLKDVNIKLGWEGLEVSTAEAPRKGTINVLKELGGPIVRLPVAAILLCGMFFNIWPLVAIVAALFVWDAAIDYAYYGNFKLKTPLLSTAANLFVALLLTAFIAVEMNGQLQYIWLEAGALTMTIGLILILFVLLYRSRFYQLEVNELYASMHDLMDRIEAGPLYIKAFYLPMALRWKVSEYFSLV